MHLHARLSVVAIAAALLGYGLIGSARQAPSPVASLVMPTGFQAAVFAEKVENARTMVLGPQGTVFVGSRTAGKVYAVVDRNGDHTAEQVTVIASGLDQPNGLAMRQGALYVATASRLLRFDEISRSTPARCFPAVIGTPSSSPSTARGTAARRADTALWLRGSMVAG